MARSANCDFIIIYRPSGIVNRFVEKDVADDRFPLVSRALWAILVLQAGLVNQKKGMREMKFVKIGGVLLLAAVTVFVGISVFLEGKDATDEDAAQQLTYYRDLTVQLENELSALRQEQYETQTAYEARIAELELQLREEEENEAEKKESETNATPSDAKFAYTVEGNAVTIIGYTGSDVKLSVPAEIDGLPVVVIGREAFKNSALEEVILPNTLKKIDWFAFYGSTRLTRVEIPRSVTKIEYGVFDGCEKLTVCCEKDSYADKYARSYGMAVEN